jgi:Rps23 Pro-64 3,4-dihydroxylase Tpa1-like proline 4-hydroxylase
VIAGVANLEGDPTWHGGGYHVTDSGGHLGPHIDYALNPRTGMERRVNLILYLNECAGGELCLWNDDATEIEATVKPLFNRAVLWCPGDTTFHSVRPVERGPRVSLACYYVTPPRAGTVRKRALFIPQREAMR